MLSERLCDLLDTVSLPIATELAALPSAIRGYVR